MAVTFPDSVAASSRRLSSSAPGTSATNTTADLANRGTSPFETILATLQSTQSTQSTDSSSSITESSTSSTATDPVLPEIPEESSSETSPVLLPSLVGELINPTVPESVFVPDLISASTAGVADPSTLLAIENPIAPDGERTRADANELAQSLVQRLNLVNVADQSTVLPSQAVADATDPEAIDPPTEGSPVSLGNPNLAVEGNPQTAIPLGLTTAATPTDTVRAASRPPSVVPQTPIVVDRPQVLPGERPFVADQPVQPPITGVPEIQPIGTATTNDQPPVPLRTGVALAQEARSALTPTAVRPAPEFTSTLALTETPDLANAPVTLPSLAASSLPPTSAVPVAVTPVVPEAEVSSEQILLSANTIPGSQPDRDLESSETSVPVAGTGPRLHAEAAVPSAPLASSTTTVARTPAAQIADGIIERASLAQSDGKVEFQMRLDPPELGPLKVKLILHGDRMSAAVVVSNDAIRSMIESQLPDLRQRLADVGLKLPDVDVSTGGGQGGTRGDAENTDWQRPLARLPGGSTSRRFPSLSASTEQRGMGSGTVDVTV